MSSLWHSPPHSTDAHFWDIGLGYPVWHRWQGTQTHYIFGVPLEWQQETWFWTALNTIQKAISVVLIFLPGLTHVSGSSQTSLSISVTNLHKQYFMPCPWHQCPRASLYTRQLHGLCAQRDFHCGLVQLTCSLSRCETAVPQSNENGWKIMNLGVSWTLYQTQASYLCETVLVSS